MRKNPPDSIILEKVAMDKKPAPNNIGTQLPSNFTEAISFDYLASTGALLNSLISNHTLDQATEIMRQASFRYYLGRSVQGILNSCSEDLKNTFNRLALGQSDQDLGESLKDTLLALKDMEPIGGHEERQVQRVKAAFSLHMAYKALDCTKQ